MITLEQHIQELRAELRGCSFAPRERREIEVELAQATAELLELEHEFDREFAEIYRES